MLTPAQVEDAIRYNRDAWGERNVDTRRIQWGTAAYPDGVWGPETIDQVAGFQEAEINLEVDGKVGPATNAALWQDILPTVGVWSIRTGDQWDRNGELYMTRLRLFGVTEVAIELNRQLDETWSPSKFRSREQLERTVARLSAAGFRVVLMLWPRPEKSYIDDLVAWLASLRLSPDTYSLELDMEGANWPDLGDPDGHWAAYLHQSLTSIGLFAYVTTHGGRLRITYSPMPYAYGISEQSYSRFDDSKPDRFWYADHGPGFFQVENLEKCEVVMAEQPEPLCTRLVCGIAGWRQFYPAYAGGGEVRTGQESILEAMFGSMQRAMRYVRDYHPGLWGGWRIWRLSFFMENMYVGEALQTFRRSWEGERVPF